MKLEQMREEWDLLRYYPNKTVREKLRSVLARRGIFPNRSDMEEQTQEALAFCWRYFREVRPKAQNAKHAVLIAARQAARAVSRGERFVADCQGKSSVLAQSGAELDLLPCHPPALARIDYSRAERIISALPDRLRGIARQLAYGDPLEAIASKQGRHPKTIERNIREMRQFISLTYWRLCDALLAALQ